jgi:SAM-dependent methyltransferase
MTEYTLDVSAPEIRRYRLMAERARTDEAELWRRAGIGPGAVVADVGSGPAAVSVLVAEIVGPTGRVIGIEPDETARAAAHRLIAEAGVGNVEVRPGTATSTGIPPATVDVAMLRHVLGHNGPHEQEIVDHLAALVCPGGSVYLIDVDGTALRMLDADPELTDLFDKYVELHRLGGDDLLAGLRLGRLLERAGLELGVHEGRYSILPLPPGLRPPAWAARQAMVSRGIASEEDIRRWQEAFVRMDAALLRPTLFVPWFVAFGTSTAPDVPDPRTRTSGS